jgi:Pvc16 N-terminal domain
MFDDLDAAINAILNDATAPIELRNADVSFETPDQNFAPAQPTVNLFLYETKENRELRDPAPIIERLGTTFIRRTPPIRMDCSYIVTTWSPAPAAARVAEEHRLLAQAILWLSRFPTIPTAFLQGTLLNQPFPVPMFVAQLDPNKNAGEFWDALNIAPRTAFYLTATIAMDLGLQLEGPLVTTTITSYQQDGDVTSAEEWINLGGVVTNAGGQPIANSWVRLEPLNQVARTDSDGRFVFVKIRRGANFTIRVRATGLGERVRVVEVPSLTGEYNVQFP